MSRFLIASTFSRLCVATLCLAALRPAQGQTFHYTGLDGGYWQVPAFWTPYNPFAPLTLQPPPTSGDIANIGNGASVLLNDSVPSDISAPGLAGLVVFNHSELHTNGHLMRVVSASGDAETNIVGTGTMGGNTRLVVNTPVGAGFVGQLVTIGNGAELRLEDALVQVENHLDVDETSIITGSGDLSLFTPGSPGERMTLNGTIRPDAEGTLTLIGGNDEQVDLDGTFGTGHLDLTNAGSQLNVHMPLTDAFSGTIDMGLGSQLDMSHAWSFSAGSGPSPVLNVNAGARFHSAVISGEEVTIGAIGGQWNIHSGALRVQADAVIRSNADINVNSNAILDFDGELELSGAASITGGGGFDPGTMNRVTGDVSIDTGSVGLYRGDWDIRESLTLNTNALEVSDFFPGNSAFDSTIDIHSQFLDFGGVLQPVFDGSLTVNLPTGEEWSLGAGSVINIFGDDQLTRTHLAGSKLNVDGAMNVDGRSRFATPIAVNESGGIHFADSSSQLQLLADSEMLGGEVSGDGTLISTGASVRGYGFVEADVDFSDSAELWADNGTLRITGNLDGLGARFGTASPKSVLQVEDVTWNAGMADQVRLNGGVLTDGPNNSFVTNYGGQIRGHGLISLHSLTNNGVIAAEGGQTLEIDGRLDWDGSSGGSSNEGDGQLVAQLGNMLLTRAMHQGPSFVGLVSVGNARTFTYDTGGNDDEILFDDVTGDSDDVQEDVGRLQMTGGTLIADIVTHEGVFDISKSRSTIEADRIRFDDLGTTSIDSELVLDASGGSYAVIEAGANIHGNGVLSNAPGSRMYLMNGADIDTRFENHGELELNSIANVPSLSGAATASVRSFAQSQTGAWLVEVYGTPPTEFDWLAVDGTAELGGALDIYGAGSYGASIGDVLELIFAGDIVGTFDSVLADGGPGVSIGQINGLDASIAVYYEDTPHLNFDENTVNARISLSGDANGDDIVDVADLGALASAWESEGTWVNGDFDGSGAVNVVDLGIMSTNWGQSAPASAAISSVPEPATALLLALAAAAWTTTGRRQRV